MKIKSVDEMRECPCGIVTDQVISWEYDEFCHTQTLCKTCQKEVVKYNNLTLKAIEEAKIIHEDGKEYVEFSSIEKMLK